VFAYRLHTTSADIPRLIGLSDHLGSSVPAIRSALQWWHRQDDAGAWLNGDRWPPLVRQLQPADDLEAARSLHERRAVATPTTMGRAATKSRSLSEPFSGATAALAGHADFRRPRRPGA
jgi:hypothetical protein